MAKKYVRVHSLNKPVGRIKFNGIFDMDGLYRLMHDWFVDRGYYLEEWRYKHKVPSPSGAEQTINWSAWRKVNAYVLWDQFYKKTSTIT